MCGGGSVACDDGMNCKGIAEFQSVHFRPPNFIEVPALYQDQPDVPHAPGLDIGLNTTLSGSDHTQLPTHHNFEDAFHTSSSCAPPPPFLRRTLDQNSRLYSNLCAIMLIAHMRLSNQVSHRCA